MAIKLTPLRQQYLDVKKQYPDTIVFFRLGDFYETFDDDARKTAEALVSRAVQDSDGQLAIFMRPSMTTLARPRRHWISSSLRGQ